MYIKKEMSFQKFRDIANYFYDAEDFSERYRNVFTNEWALRSMYEYVDESFSILDKHIEDNLGVVGRPIGDFTYSPGQGRIITLADIQPSHESRVLWLFDFFEVHQSNLSYEPDDKEPTLKQVVAVLNKKDYTYTLFRNNKALPTEQGMQHNTTKQGN
jgi:hypothetical protein